MTHSKRILMLYSIISLYYIKKQTTDIAYFSRIIDDVVHVDWNVNILYLFKY